MDFLLYFLIKRVLAKYRPTVIGIFGDDEKEVVKEALYSLLYSKYKGEVVRSSANPDQSASAVWNTLLRLDKKSSVWSGVLKALSLLLFGGDYPRYVIIEYPINAPGKMSYFLEIVKPDIAILGAITDRNLEYFGSLEKEVAEKGKLLDALGKKDLLVLNLDNENT
ncbi:MAG: hypothetical protein HY602_01940, partial [Parcubacteria group bacterium]|nr:hypothetical protein [Parcubacteria group bacterium]